MTPADYRSLAAEHTAAGHNAGTPMPPRIG